MILERPPHARRENGADLPRLTRRSLAARWTDGPHSECTMPSSCRMDSTPPGGHTSPASASRLALAMMEKDSSASWGGSAQRFSRFTRFDGGTSERAPDAPPSCASEALDAPQAARAQPESGRSTLTRAPAQRPRSSNQGHARGFARRRGSSMPAHGPERSSTGDEMPLVCLGQKSDVV